MGPARLVNVFEKKKKNALRGTEFPPTSIDKYAPEMVNCEADLDNDGKLIRNKKRTCSPCRMSLSVVMTMFL